MFLRVPTYLLFPLLLTAFCCSAYSQSTPGDDYIIDASQRSGEKSRLQTQTIYWEEDITLVVLNKRLYRGAMLVRLLPYLKQHLKSIRVSKEAAIVRRYSTDPAFRQLVKLKLSRKPARKLRKQYPELSVN